MTQFGDGSRIPMRTKEVKLSDEEHRELTNYKQEKYPAHTPFGYIIGELVEEARE